MNKSNKNNWNSSTQQTFQVLGQWSHAYFKFHQELVADEVLGDSTVAITYLNPI